MLGTLPMEESESSLALGRPNSCWTRFLLSPTTDCGAGEQKDLLQMHVPIKKLLPGFSTTKLQWDEGFGNCCWRGFNNPSSTAAARAWESRGVIAHLLKLSFCCRCSVPAMQSHQLLAGLPGGHFLLPLPLLLWVSQSPNESLMSYTLSHIDSWSRIKLDYISIYTL